MTFPSMHIAHNTRIAARFCVTMPAVAIRVLDRADPGGDVSLITK